MRPTDRALARCPASVRSARPDSHLRLNIRRVRRRIERKIRPIRTHRLRKSRLFAESAPGSWTKFFGQPLIFNVAQSDLFRDPSRFSEKLRTVSRLETSRTPTARG